MRIQVLSADDWKQYSEKAHLIVFNERRPKELERIDYALLVETDDGLPCAFATVKELDAETAYFQFGGAFPNVKGTISSLKAYRVIMDFVRNAYKRAGTLIENTNTPMLKFAMNEGWLVMGLRVFEGSILLEHKIDFTGVKQ